MPIVLNGSTGVISGISVGGLPDGCVDSDTLASGLATQGIQVIDTWRLTGDTNNATNGIITANWERADTHSVANIGTGMTHSSGYFTFPQTGIYLIQSSWRIYVGTADDYAANVSLDLTTDNSSYTYANVATSAEGLDGGTNSASSHFVFDVTNTTTHKIRWSTHSFASNTQLQGDTNQNVSYFTVFRLGDT